MQIRNTAEMVSKQVCAAEMAVRYAALCASRKVHTWRWPISENRSFFFILDVRSQDGTTVKLQNYFREWDGRTDRRTDRQTDRVRRNMRPPPTEEGRIIMPLPSAGTYCHCQQTPSHQCSREFLSVVYKIILSIQDQGQGPPSRPKPRPRTWCIKAKDKD